MNVRPGQQGDGHADGDAWSRGVVEPELGKRPSWPDPTMTVPALEAMVSPMVRTVVLTAGEAV